MKSQKNLSVNSYGKIIKNLKKIIHECVAKDWLPKDPFSLYKVKHIDPQVPHLSADELQKIEVKEFTIERLALVRDLFLFSCYTGLAYIDAANLTLDNIVTGFDGRQWVVKNREKTNVMSRIPLLQPAQKILEKYKDHPKTGNTGKLLPMMSNQKVNSYLRMSLIDWTAKFDDLPRSPAAIAVLEDLQTLYKYPFGREIWAKLWFKYVARRNWVKGSLILTLRGKKWKAVRSFRMKEKTRSRSRKPVNVSWESNGRCRNSCYTVKLKKWKHR